MYRIGKILVSVVFFKFNKYFFSTGTPTTNKLNDGIGAGTAFLGLQLGTGTLKLQTNSI